MNHPQVPPSLLHVPGMAPRRPGPPQPPPPQGPRGGRPAFGWPRRAVAAGRPLARLWWLHPAAIVAMIGLVYACFPAFDFSRVVPRVYVPGLHYAWGGLLLVALAAGIGAGARLGSGGTHPAAPNAAVHIPRWATAGLLAATLFAYAVWFLPAWSNPALLLDVVAGRRSNLRDVAPTTPGVTTMTQFGVAFAIAHAVLHAGRARPLALWERAGMWVVFTLAVVRAFAWSERLAVIEIALCWSVAWMAFAQVRRARTWTAFRLLPLVAPVALYLAFTATESVRSWTFYQREYSSIWAFSFDRLLAYYATATNNGIGLLVENRQWPQYSGRFVAEWLYLMPVIGDSLRQGVGDVQPQYFEFLSRYARPEFNNPSGLFPIVFDIGYTGSALYFTAVGLAIGRLWAAWRRRRPAGVLAYPVAVLFLFELLRFDYLAASRFFPVALGLVFLWWVARAAAGLPEPRR